MRYQDWQDCLWDYHWLFLGMTWPMEAMQEIGFLEWLYHEAEARCLAMEEAIRSLTVTYNSALHQERLRCIAERRA